MVRYPTAPIEFPLNISRIFTDSKATLEFINDWNNMFDEQHLWLDKKTLNQCRIISIYLNKILELFRIDEYELNISMKLYLDASNRIISDLGYIAYKDYFTLVNDLYDNINYNIEKMKLKTSKISRISSTKKTEKWLDKKFDDTILGIYFIMFMVRFLIYLGINSHEEMAKYLQKKVVNI